MLFVGDVFTEKERDTGYLYSQRKCEIAKK